MHDTEAGTENKTPVMSKEDIAYFIRTMWESLLKPTWSRPLLIDFGTAIHDKVQLSKLDPDRLGKLLPYLSTVAEHFGQQVTIKFTAEFNVFLRTMAKSHPEAFPDLSESPSETIVPVLNREEIAYFIRTMWDALLRPNWERGDLIDLGMAVFTKTTLAKMDQKKLGRLLPSLSMAAEYFGQQVTTKFSAKFDGILKAMEADRASKEQPLVTATSEQTPSTSEDIEAPVTQTQTNEQTPADQTSLEPTTAEEVTTEPQGETNG